VGLLRHQFQFHQAIKMSPNQQLNYGSLVVSITSSSLVDGHSTSHQESQESHPSRKSGSHTSDSEENVKTFVNILVNVLEWYAFAVFGYLSDILAEVFFPPGQGEATALIESFAVFGGAFVMRPLGGLWMGYLGDRYGRKMALEVSIFLMAISTLCLGCLPTYAQVGHWSYISLIFFRLMQGLSAGGQLMSSLVYAVEGKPKEHWGFHGSCVMAAANFGNLLSGVTVDWLRRCLTEEQVAEWGWRLPNLSGILLCICGVYLKYYHCSSDEEAASSDKPAKIPPNPLVLAFAPENRRPLLAACTVPILWSAGFWLTFDWMTIYMFELIPNPMPQAFGINSSSLFLSVCVFFPLAGAFSDQIGRRCVMTIGGVGFGVTSPFLLIVIGQGNVWLAFFSQCWMGVCLSLWGAPMMAWLAESFDPKVRLTSAAVGYNLGVGIFAGIAPAMATFLVDEWGYKAPSFLLASLAAIGLTGLWVVAPRPSASTTSSTSSSGASSRYLEDFPLI
jgi:MHS family proline/betaine transporter-like MFS transporter